MNFLLDAFPRNRPGFLRLVLGLGISALFLYAVLATVQFSEVVGILRGTRPRWIAVALLCLFAAYALKIIRWRMMLNTLGAKVRFREAGAGFLVAVAFNNILPLRAGDVIRAVTYTRLTGVQPSGQVGTLLLERLLDLLVLTVLLFTTISFWTVDLADEMLLAGLRLTALAVAGATLLFIAAPAPLSAIIQWLVPGMGRLRPAGEALLRLLHAVQTLSRPSFLIQTAALSFLAWLFEGGVYYSTGRALGIAAGPEAALLALSVGTLSTIIPSSPGYVGTFHYFTARAIAVFGIGQTASAAFALLVHAVLWLATTAAGIGSLGFLAFNGKSAVSASKGGTL